MKLKKSETLRGQRLYREVMNDGERLRRKHLTCFCLTRPLTDDTSSEIQVGFSVDSRLTNAVGRNKAKRLMRESYRRLKKIVQGNTDTKSVALIFSVKRFEKDISFHQIYAEMKSLLEEIAANCLSSR